MTTHELTASAQHNLAGRLLFICGLHRSGTSVVHRCLGDHPDVSAFRNTGVPQDEGQFLQTVYNRGRAHGGPGRFGFDPKAHLTETSELVTDRARGQLAWEWGKHWDLSRRILVEKSPPNLIRTRFLRAMFPGSRFLVVVRDPVAVVGATQKWRRRPATSLVHHWVVCHETMAADTEGFEDVQILRYEEFVADPDAALAEVFRRLDLEPVLTSEPVRRGADDAYRLAWAMRPRTSLRWYDERVAERLYGRRAESLGYRFPARGVG